MANILEKNIFSYAAPKVDLVRRKGIFSPLELYLYSPFKEQFIPENTVYVTAAASSGGYRAYLDRWSSGGSPAWKPSGNRQHAIIGMNTTLITKMVGMADLPATLQNKTFLIPHEIGVDVSDTYGTLMGKNEADLMMHWMMRISGVSASVATSYYETMMNKHSNAREIIGDPTIPKSQKNAQYIELIQTFLDTVRASNDPRKPVSAIMLGLDWKHSLGSRLEAAVGYILGIPLYEVILDKSHPEYQTFISTYHLEKIIDLIHFPTIEGDGQYLISAISRNPEYIENIIGDLLKQIH